MKSSRFYLLLSLCLLISGCNTKNNQIQTLEEEQQDFQLLKDTLEERTFTRLKSGVILENAGLNYFIERDIILSERQIKTLSDNGEMEEPIFTEDAQNTKPIMLSSGKTWQADPETSTRK